MGSVCLTSIPSASSVCVMGEQVVELERALFVGHLSRNGI